MTKQEAITYLGGNEEEVEEFLTQHIFDLKSNQLRSAILPQVLLKKAEKLNVMADALIELGYEDEQLAHQAIDLALKSKSKDDVISFFRSYEQQMSSLKLLLMQAHHPRIVAQLLKALADLESLKWMEINKKFRTVANDETIKLSEYIDSGLIILELRNAEENLEIDHQMDQLPTLKKEINKSIKYCKFTESKKQ